MSSYQVVSKGQGARHIDGLNYTGSYSKNAGLDADRGMVEYAPESACAGLTRIGSFRYTWKTLDTITEVTEYLALADRLDHKVCKTCRKAAEAAAGQEG